MRNDRPWVAAQMSNMPSQAEKYAEAHCDTLVDWLKKNTKPCACVDKYELDSGKDSVVYVCLWPAPEAR